MRTLRRAEWKVIAAQKEEEKEKKKTKQRCSAPGRSRHGDGDHASSGSAWQPERQAPDAHSDAHANSDARVATPGWPRPGDAEAAEAAFPRELIALGLRPLHVPPGHAVAHEVEHAAAPQLPVAALADPGEEVEGHGQVGDPAQVAQQVRELARELVVREVEHLDPRQARERPREVSRQRVVAEVQHLHAGEEAQRLGHAAGQVVVQEQHLADPATGPGPGAGAELVGRRDGAGEVVVGQRDDRGGRRPQRVRDLALELVVVEEHGVQLLGEHLGRDLPGEGVEAEVQVHQRRDEQRGRRERAREEVVAQVQLRQVLQVPERVGDGAPEPVAVEVEEGEVRQEGHRVGERAPEVGAVEVDARDYRRRAGGRGAVGRRGAVHALVGAHIGALPRRERSLGVVGDGHLQRLQRRVLLAPRARGGGGSGVRARRRRAVNPGGNGGTQAELGGRGGG
jgi:hypothetical protein